jgi:hypothetical protein
MLVSIIEVTGVEVTIIGPVLPREIVGAASIATAN